MTLRELVLGRDHLVYGRLDGAATSGRSAWAISIGADVHSPSRASKGDPRCANEDALLLIDEGQRALLAVADAHFGIRASHELLTTLEAELTRVPRTAQELGEALRSLSARPPAPPDASSTTLAIAVLDRTQRTGFGLAFGDSSCIVVDREGAHAVHTRGRAAFVALDEPLSLEPALAQRFAFEARPAAAVVVYTDGVDECHYGKPRTSVRAQHVHGLWTSCGGDAWRFARGLGELALQGVDGHPGGQDNLALVVATVP